MQSVQEIPWWQVFLAGYMEHASYGEAFRTAVAAGSASAFSEHLATRAEIEQILPLLLDSYQMPKKTIIMEK